MGPDSTRRALSRAALTLVIAVVTTCLAVAGVAAARPTTTPHKRHTTHRRHRTHKRHRAHKRRATHKRHRRHHRHHRILPGNGIAMPVPTGGVVQFNREAYHILPGTDLAALARNNQVLVLNGTDGSLVHTLHRYNPHLIVLLYSFVEGAEENDPRGLNYCATPQQVAAGNWYLRDSAGNTGLNLRQTPGTIGVDPGNPSYEQACADNTARIARQYGFDGVMFDGLDARLQYEFGNISVPEYPTDASYQYALTRLLTTLRTVLHGDRLQLWGNVGGATSTPGLWQRWASIMDGTEEESWTDGSLGLAQQVPDFPAKLANAAWSVAHDRYFLGHTWNMTETGNTYGLAAMLLVANGYASYSTSGDSYDNGQTLSFPEFATARQLGAPTGGYSLLRNGLYVRHFTHGEVVVNPTLGSLTTSLGGTFTGSGLSHAAAATLAPTSGLILLRG